MDTFKTFDSPINSDKSRPTSNTNDENKAEISTSPLKAKNVKDDINFDGQLEKDKLKENKPCKGFSRFLVSNVGMITIVLIYVFAGAYLFQILEQHDEISRCQTGEGAYTTSLQNLRAQLFNYIYLNTTSNPWLPIDNSSGTASASTKDPPSVYQPKLTNWLKDFRDNIISLNNNYKYRGQDCEGQSMWTYFSSVLFAFTVVSTIGYGHIAPATWQGQLVCICYALLGVPLFLISIANVSGVLADIFRFIYSNVFCIICRRLSLKYNDDKKKTTDKAEVMADTKIEDTHGILDDSNAKVIDDDEDEDDEDSKNQKTNVPLFIVLCVLFGYMVFGGWIFTLIEAWTLVVGIYFSFVSLGTLGFGDYVPGITDLSNGENSKAVRNLILAFLYIFFGMAIMAMCIDLLQDQMISKFKAISRKLGLSKAVDGEVDENELNEENLQSKNEISTIMKEKNADDLKALSKSEQLKMQLENLKEQNKLRKLSSSLNQNELTLKNSTTKAENKVILVKSFNETTRKANFESKC